MLETNGGTELAEKRNSQRSNPQGLEVGDLILFKEYGESACNTGSIGVVVGLEVTPANVYEQETTDAVIYWSGKGTDQKERIDAIYLEKISN